MIRTYGIKVRFEGCSKEYSYKSFEKLTVGDMVVVQAKDGIALARVSEIDCDSPTATKFVVCRIDIEKIHDLMAKYEAQKVLEDRLEQLYMETSKMDMYRKLAETNEEARDLVEQLEKINQ